MAQLKKDNSNKRITEIMLQLMEGDKINLNEMVEKYAVSKRTIQRDISTIKNNFKDSENFEYLHDTVSQEYYLKKNGEIPFEEILAIMKVLIGTRAFSKAELRDISDDLLLTVGSDDQKIIKKTLTTIRSGYQPISKTDHLIQDVLKFNKFIDEQTTIEFSYQSSDVTRKKSRQHEGVPLSLYFADHYFYVAMYIVKSENAAETGTYVYRIDRFDDNINVIGKKIKVPRELWEDEDTIRDKTFLLNSGDKISYVFSYRGYPQVALDQLPGSKLKLAADGTTYRDKSGGVIVEGSLSFNGAFMWVMGQGDKVTVKAPQSLIKEVTGKLRSALDNY